MLWSKALCRKTIAADCSDTTSGHSWRDNSFLVSKRGNCTGSVRVTIGPHLDEFETSKSLNRCWTCTFTLQMTRGGGNVAEALFAAEKNIQNLWNYCLGVRIVNANFSRCFFIYSFIFTARISAFTQGANRWKQLIQFSTVAALGTSRQGRVEVGFLACVFYIQCQKGGVGLGRVSKIIALNNSLKAGAMWKSTSSSLAVMDSR